ncbi:uncharacterized protein LALA0_S04e04104g [Lachancea lanzarotensis]|uniref:LALA0S04e04104g1_1 n=1 Tax=Lachancea lanzarotensis TaxID=1245769 RepID=A0A0C7MWG3_9SACH|nr:uncharacterized protein LALA0_S04e04104g [Lachancea lanzarotensis]CEP61940.1 LALA0S04e04104g1_1 [Lachancea lanzarotensis]
MDATELDGPSIDSPVDTTNDLSPQIIEDVRPASPVVEHSTNSSNTTNENSSASGLLYEDNFHSLLVPSELSTIRHPKEAAAKLGIAIDELIRKNGYKTLDEGKEFRFRWDNTSAYYLAKNCLQIGPFLGFENLKPNSSSKLEPSSLISLKWCCIWYNLLLSIKFKDKRVPTESQLRTKFKYLMEIANTKINAITTGDERNPCAITGDDKTDEIIEDLMKLKNAADDRRTELPKLEMQRQSQKRALCYKSQKRDLCNKSQKRALCTNSLPQVAQNLEQTNSDSSFSPINDVKAPNVRTIIKRPRVNRSMIKRPRVNRSMIKRPRVNHSIEDMRSDAQLLHVSAGIQLITSHMLQSLMAAFGDMKQAGQEKNEKIQKAEEEKVALQMLFEERKIKIAEEKLAIEREKIAFEKHKFDISQVAIISSVLLGNKDKSASINVDVEKLLLKTLGSLTG